MPNIRTGSIARLVLCHTFVAAFVRQRKAFFFALLRLRNAICMTFPHFFWTILWTRAQTSRDTAKIKQGTVKIGYITNSPRTLTFVRDIVITMKVYAIKQRRLKAKNCNIFFVIAMNLL